MSRYSFGEILENETLLLESARSRDGADGLTGQQDLKGHQLQTWLDCAVVGWDEPLQTYFVQGPAEGDELSWWLGTTHEEIPTFTMLCRLIRLIFDDKVPFEFVDRIDTAPEPESLARLFGGDSDTTSALTRTESAATVEPASLI
jgi:hypothetical protein